MFCALARIRFSSGAVGERSLLDCFRHGKSIATNATNAVPRCSIPSALPQDMVVGMQLPSHSLRGGVTAGPTSSGRRSGWCDEHSGRPGRLGQRLPVHPHFCLWPFKGENRGGAATGTDWSQPVVLFCAHLGVQGNSIPATATEGWHSFFPPWPELYALPQGSRVELHGVANNATLEAESSMAAAGISGPSSDEPGFGVGQRNVTGCLSAADVLR